MFTELDSLHNCFMLHEIKNKEYVLTEDLALHFIELPKTKNANIRLTKWAEFIGNDDPLEDEMTILLKNDTIMQRAHEAFKRCTQDEELRELALSREKFQRDAISRLNAARREGLAEGEAKGKLEISCRMYADGIAIATIARITGLSEEEVQKAITSRISG